MENENKDNQDLTFSDVENWIEQNKDSKSWKDYILPQIDQAVTTGINSYRNNHLDSEVDEKVNAASEQFLKRESDVLKRESLADLREMAITRSVEKGVSPALGLRMVDTDFKTTSNNLVDLFSEIDKNGDRKWTQFLKQNAHTPQSGDEEKNDSLKSMVLRSKDPEYFAANKERIYDKLSRGEKVK